MAIPAGLGTTAFVPAAAYRCFGVEQDTAAGDGFPGWFHGGVWAIRRALAIHEAMRDLDLQRR